MLFAGQGHRGEWTIPVAEMEGPAPETTAKDIAEVSGRPHQPAEIPEPPAGVKQGSSPSALNAQELEAVIETVLDRKLKPITRMLVDAQQKGPTARDILGGIGYILGLVGIAAYVHSRKKKA